MIRVNQKHRIVSFIIVIMILFSLSFVVFSGNHACSHENCEICCMVEKMGENMNHPCPISPSHSVCLTVLFFTVCLYTRIGQEFLHTLITLKVKLSD